MELHPRSSCSFTFYLKHCETFCLYFSHGKNGNVCLMNYIFVVEPANQDWSSMSSSVSSSMAFLLPLGRDFVPLERTLML